MTIQELYTAIDGNYESAKRILPMDKLIEKFIVKVLDDKSIDRLKNAKGSHDAQELFEASHAMKGMCANLGLDKLSAMASVISEEFRPGKSRTMDDAAIDEKIDAFVQKFDVTTEEIKKFVASK